MSDGNVFVCWEFTVVEAPLSAWTEHDGVGTGVGWLCEAVVPKLMNGI
mgnify:CR=1